MVGKKAGIKVGRTGRGREEMKAVWCMGEKHRNFSRVFLGEGCTVFRCVHMLYGQFQDKESV